MSVIYYKLLVLVIALFWGWFALHLTC